MAEVVVAPEGRGGTPPSFGHAGLALADRAARPGAHVVRKRQMATAVVVSCRAYARSVLVQWEPRSWDCGGSLGPACFVGCQHRVPSATALLGHAPVVASH